MEGVRKNVCTLKEKKEKQQEAYGWKDRQRDMQRGKKKKGCTAKYRREECGVNNCCVSMKV